MITWKKLINYLTPSADEGDKWKTSRREKQERTWFRTIARDRPRKRERILHLEVALSGLTIEPLPFALLLGFTSFSCGFRALGSGFLIGGLEVDEVDLPDKFARLIAARAASRDGPPFTGGRSVG